jgi:hypothetical protein
VVVSAVEAVGVDVDVVASVDVAAGEVVAFNRIKCIPKAKYQYRCNLYNMHLHNRPNLNLPMVVMVMRRKILQLRKHARRS